MINVHGKVRNRFTLLALLSFAGLIVSGILTRHFYMIRGGAEGFKSYCNISATMNCDVVAASRFAELVGGFPLSSFAAGWFLALAIIAIIGRGSTIWQRDTARTVFIMTGFSLVMSLVYLVIMAWVLKTFCINCLITDGINLLSFLAAFSIMRELKPSATSSKTAIDAAKIDPNRFKSFAWVTLGSVFILVIGLQTLSPETMDAKRVGQLSEMLLDSTAENVGAGQVDMVLSGNAQSPVTVYEFLDFQCPSCRMGAQTVNTVINRYGAQVRVILRAYPLDPKCNAAMKNGGHPTACESAHIAYCAHEQGLLTETYHTLFDHQETIEPGLPTELARKIPGMDESKLLGCIGSDAAKSAVQADIGEGDRLGIQSTPTFFINGHKMEGAMPLQVWVRAIDTLIAQAPKR